MGMLDIQDIHVYVVKHPTTTYFMACASDALIGAGIFPRDTLVIDKALDAKSGDIIIAVYAGDFYVRRYTVEDDQLVLLCPEPEDLGHQPILVGDREDFEIWGVVTFVIHHLANTTPGAER